MSNIIRFFRNTIIAMITIIHATKRRDIPTDKAIILFLVCSDEESEELVGSGLWVGFGDSVGVAC